ncbi:MAG: alpha-glucosidase [Alphaproteobacteria bacterium]|nr:alpha-glucosidase [Alphaproteobacteria bacterium]USO08554.1 MAG: alpha-glucosidase [Rhodospirillales bacterium]
MQTAQANWWKGAVIYQVYPRSFQDSRDDGVGDLNGLIQRLPYIAALGVDAIWVSPFFKSPMRDFGYDVQDYRDVDPLFGTLSDADRLIEEAHRLNLKIIFDIVLSHTSDLHPWFEESRRRQNGKESWYVWADPKPDGSPPTNWVSLFGGPAWNFDPLRGQYYLHNFLKEQPDLNFHNPDVQDAVLDIARFWLDRGVDGFRLDVVNFYFHDDELRDNPARPRDMGFALQYESPDPYSMQRHLYDKSRPENIAFIERLRALTDSYPARVLIGEIGDDYQTLRMAEYTHGDKRLHTAYSFALLSGTDVHLTPLYIRKAVEEEMGAGGASSWPCWAFSNHDTPRAPSRFGQRFITNPAWPRLLLALEFSLRGTICLYQGEELGLPEANVPREKLQDPWGKRVWPVWQGRDGARTPMPWSDTMPHAGFSSVEPWLPLAPEHQGLSVASQEAAEDSTLHMARRLLAFRRARPALLHGAIKFISLPDHPSVLAFTRTQGAESFLCVFNLADAPVSLRLPARLSDGENLISQAELSGADIALSAFGFALLPAAAASMSPAKENSFWTKALSVLGSLKGLSVRHSKNARS